MKRAAAIVVLALLAPAAAPAATLTGVIRDAPTGEPMAARVYLRSEQGQWFFPKSADPAGMAIEYRKERSPTSAEMHTALSAHPFTIDLAPGKYKLTVERGKEYLPHEETVTIGEKPVKVEVSLRRWVNMAEKGWYSGDTHVHRTLDELPTAMLADDLNVALPLTYWVTKANTPPAQGDKNLQPVEAKVIEVAPRRLIWPLNTEYEIFTVGGKQHTLGAVFGLGHKTVLAGGVPPVRPIAEQVHREGGLLDLDKHNWPWSMALVPVMDVDLFELANNHHWRTEFFYKTFGEPIPSYMGLPADPAGFSEKSWTEFGFQNYYALLNCGFRLMPTAGTATGVHPVPLGWGRVYVNCPDGFSFENWMKGLKAGRSFVTTGPMLLFDVNDQPPGSVIAQTAESKNYSLNLQLWAASGDCRYEIIEAGQVVEAAQVADASLSLVNFAKHPAAQRSVKESTWFAVRVFEKLPDGRERFAHSAPIFIDVPGKPLRPRKAEVQYLISRVQGEIDRNHGVLSAEALAEFNEALARYQKIAQTAK